jgi:predicted permease
MLSRLFAFFRRGRLDRELNDEVRFHLDMLEAEFRARGLTAEDARLQARREFGAVEPMKEVYRDRRGLRWLDELARDLRYGFRGLRQHPGFTLAAVLSLGLGIGMNAAVYSVFHALLVQTLPVERPQELVSLYRTGGWGKGVLSFPLYQDLRDHTDVFTGVLACNWVTKTRLDGERAEFLDLEYVSGNYFSLLGIQPAAGRLLTPADAPARGESPVAVLSYNAWRNRFALDPHIVGRSLVFDGKPFTVVGVAQPGFRGVEVERSAEVWVPLTMNAGALSPGTHWLWAIARRKPGVTDARIQAEVAGLFSRYLEVHYGRKPDSDFRRTALEQRLELRPGGIGISFMRAEFEKPVRILMGAVILVLLIACANVAGLLLARGAARSHEMALRFSLGASRWRLIRQWLTESAILAAGGALLGWAFAAWAARAAARLLPGLRNADALPVETGGSVLLFVAAVATASALFFGVAAGLGATSGIAAPCLRGGATGLIAGRLRLGVRKGLVAAQVALAVVLVVTAGLFVRSLAGLETLDPGFHNYSVLAFSLDAPRSYSAAARASLPGRSLDRVSALPGVMSASAGFPGPYQRGSSSGDLFVPGRESSGRADVARQTVYPRYFETLGSSLLKGRWLDDRDRPGGRKVAVVNQAFAERYFPGQDPVGRTIGLNAGGPADVAIVGVVRNMQHDGLRQPAVPAVYLPELQEPSSMSLQFLVHAAIPPADALQMLRREAAALDPALAIEEPQTVRQMIGRSLFQERMLAALSAIFGILALSLAAIGLYGVVSFVVTRRTAEIGIRMALGAPRSGVVWMVLREVLLVVAAGVLISVPAALAATRLGRGILFGIRPEDPAVIVGSAAVLLAAGLCAGIVPALRAARIDPAQSLRTE